MMKTKNILVIAGGVLFGTTLLSFHVLNQKWNVNVKEAKITFDMPNGRHNGTVGGLNTTFEFNPMDPSQSSIVATVAVNQLKADNDKLTEHLMTADFFDAANHPEIKFTSDSIRKNDTAYVAYGKLAMRDSIHTIAVPFKFIQEGKKATFKGSMDIFAGDYGIGKKSEKGNDRVVIGIEVPVSEE